MPIYLHAFITLPCQILSYDLKKNTRIGYYDHFSWKTIKVFCATQIYRLVSLYFKNAVLDVTQFHSMFFASF